MFIQKEMTPEEFLAFADQHPDKRFDFIDGDIVEVSPKPVHGRKQIIFGYELESYTRKIRLARYIVKSCMFSTVRN